MKLCSAPHDSLRRAASAWALGGLVALGGCLADAPHTTQGGWAPQCDATPVGQNKGCLAIVFSSDGDARSSGKLTGNYHWALYHDGDVKPIIGPVGDPAYDGSKNNVDLTALGATDITYAPSLPAANYQILAYLDYNLNDSADEDEPITTLTNGFSVPPDEMTTVESVLVRLKPF